MSLFSMIRRDRTTSTRRRPQAFRPGLQPTPESLESRLVLSAAAAQVAAPTAALNNLINITGVQLTNFQVVNNVLTAAGTVTGTLAGLPFTANITNFALHLIPDNPGTPATECAVLNLELQPIHLNLLGLHVDTSPICLDVTATQGGGLLGDLLCGLAGGGGLPTIPTTGQLSSLQSGLANLLGGALNHGNGNGNGGGGGGESVCTGECEVLDLSLGPVNLSLLGLNVSLDDCNNGPVQICVSATRTGPQGGLLGSLLCGLTGSPNLNLNANQITRLVQGLGGIVNNSTALASLTTTVNDILADGVVTQKEFQGLSKVIRNLA